jgi:pyridoxal/pyridoxine/pyridoxamine kinase
MNEDQKEPKKVPKVSKEFRITNLITTSVIAIVALVFSGYLFSIGQTGIGGTLAGMVIAHYFSRMANTDAAGQIESVIARIPEAWGSIAESEVKISNSRINQGGAKLG